MRRWPLTAVRAPWPCTWTTPRPPRQSLGTPRRGTGMSGAAVWAAGRIVAVVAEHHPGEGTGRLTARRIDRAYDQLPRT